jgi:hypothetical protein
MGRKPGSKNVITRESLARIEKLVDKHGSPTRAMFESLKYWVGVRDAELAKTSRHRNGAKIDKACEWILKFGTALAPFTDKRQPTAIQSEIKHVPTVIRAPKTIPDSQEWLRLHKPKHIDATPVLERFSTALQQSYNLADELGIDDAAAVMKEAKRRMEDDNG